jgi:hypothetical protein
MTDTSKMREGDDIVAKLERLAVNAEASKTYVHEFRPELGRTMRADGVADIIYEAMDEIVDLRVEIEEMRYHLDRLWRMVPHPEETDDERLLRDYRRGVKLEMLSKERGSTRERIRHRLKKLGAIT